MALAYFIEGKARQVIGRLWHEMRESLSPRPKKDVSTLEHPNSSAFKTQVELRATNPWNEAAWQLFARCRVHAWWIVLVAISAGLVAAAVQPLLPPVYKVTTEIYIDPKGLGVDSNVNFDANAAINFVESQMLLVKSDAVLIEVLRRENASGNVDLKPGLLKRIKHYLLPRSANDEADANDAEAIRLDGLRRAVEVERIGRSFVVSLSVKDNSREIAAQRTRLIIDSFLDLSEQYRKQTTRATVLAVTTRNLAVSRGELIDLVSSLGSEHPTVKSMREKIEQLKGRLAQAARAPNVSEPDDARAVSSAFLRVIAPVRVPMKKGWLMPAVLWLVIGSVLGGLLAIAWLAFGLMREKLPAIGHPD